MATGFDRSVEELEQRVIEQARAVYSDKGVNEFHNPKTLGRTPEPDARGLVHGWCGDTMEIYLRLKEERIEAASFMTDGCGPTVACGSMLTTMVQGMSLTEASEVRPKDLLEALDGLPGGLRLCGDATCSAFTGSALAFGLLYPRPRAHFDGDRENRYLTYALIQRLRERFAGHFGSVRCHDVHRHELGRAFNPRDPAERKAFEAAGAHEDKCTGVVACTARWVVEIVG